MTKKNQKKFKIPKNYTLEEVLSIIDKVANTLAERFKFSYHAFEDIAQQARMFALESVSKYDGVRPLENYLRVVVHNRLCNYKRDNYIRLYKPCEKCKRAKCLTPESCTTYLMWEKCNLGKMNLASPISIQNVDDDNESNMYSSINFDSLVHLGQLSYLIDKYLPIRFRQDFVKLRDGHDLPKSKRDVIFDEIRLIFVEHGHPEEAEMIEDYNGK